MPTSLDEIVENKRREVMASKAKLDASLTVGSGGAGVRAERQNAEMRAQAEAEAQANEQALASNSFYKALKPGRTNLICEVKPKSPSAGNLRSADDWKVMVDAYKLHAAALSVLTDEKYFGGSLELYREIKNYVDMPMLRKDFIIDPFQCHESASCNSDAALLIVKILTDDELRLLHALLLGYGIAPVVEVQSELEVERALKVAPQIVLINNRDLSTFKTDIRTTERLCGKIPSSVRTISASGIEGAPDLESILPYCNNFLIGSALMRSADPVALLAALTEAGSKVKS